MPTPYRLRPIIAAWLVATVLAVLVTSTPLVPATATSAADSGAPDQDYRVDRETPTFIDGRLTPEDPDPTDPESPHDAHTDPDPTQSLRARRVDQDPFVLFGLHLDEAPAHEGDVQVRFLQDQTWTDWIEVPGDHGPDLTSAEGANSPRFVSEPILVDGADGYELSLDSSLRTVSTGAEVLLVRATHERVGVQPGDAVPADPRVTRGTGMPTIRGRGWWGAAPYRGTPEIADHLQLGLVHHTVSTNAYTPEQVPGMIRAIQRFHQDGNGWDDIAYNFVVDRYGRIWEGRAGGVDKAVIGGHARGFNTGSVGVVALGEFTSSVPTGSMQDAIGEVLGWKMFIHGVDPDGRVDFESYGNELHPDGTVVNLPRIGGHRDTGATACPGAQLYAYLGVIRAGAIAGYNRRVGSGDFQSRSVTVSGTYTPLVGDFDGDSVADVFWYGPGAARDGLWYGDGDGTFTAVPVTVRGTYLPLVGDFNGDRRDDIFWYGPGSANDSVWIAQPGGGFRSRTERVRGTYLPLVGEFTGDDAEDILWYGSGTAADGFWQGTTNKGFISRPMSVNGAYRPLVGDFDGDWRDDIFWYKPGAGADSLWLGRTKGAFAHRRVSVKGTYWPIVGDVDGNGRDDILWYGYEEPTTQNGASTSHLADSLWLAGGGGGFGVARVDQPLNSLLPLAGDFTGGGLDDVFWYGAGSTDDEFWHSVGPGQYVKRDKAVSGDYQPLVGDFNGDARDDIFWYGPGGNYDALWLGTG